MTLNIGQFKKCKKFVPSVRETSEDQKKNKNKRLYNRIDSATLTKKTNMKSICN